jgi:hypothetical protein
VKTDLIVELVDDEGVPKALAPMIMLQTAAAADLRTARVVGADASVVERWRVCDA